MKRAGRKAMYTNEEIARLKCVRCGNPAVSQWSACADGNLNRPLCKPCDVGLNAVALFFIGDPKARQKIVAYANQEGFTMEHGYFDQVVLRMLAGEKFWCESIPKGVD